MSSYVTGPTSDTSLSPLESIETEEVPSKPDLFSCLPDGAVAKVVDYLSFPVAQNSLSKVSKRFHNLLVGRNNIKPLLSSKLNLQSYRRITDNNLRVLIGIPLRHLLLPADTELSDIGLRYLSYFPLRRLVLARLKITGSGLAYLPNTIKGLSLYKCHNILDRELVHLSRLFRLEVLYLDGVKVENERLRDLENLPLKELYLNECEVSDAGIRYLLGLNLKKLTLSRCQVTNIGIRQLSQIPSLKSLTLSNSIHVNKAGVRALKQAAPELSIRFFSL